MNNRVFYNNNYNSNMTNTTYTVTTKHNTTQNPCNSYISKQEYKPQNTETQKCMEYKGIDDRPSQTMGAAIHEHLPWTQHIGLIMKQGLMCN